MACLDYLWDVKGCGLVACLLNVPSTSRCVSISRMGLFRQVYMLPHWDRSCRSNFISHPVTVQYIDTGPTSPREDPVHGKAATGVPIFKSLVWLKRDHIKRSHNQWRSESQNWKCHRAIWRPPDFSEKTQTEVVRAHHTIIWTGQDYPTGNKEGDEEADTGNDGKTTSKSGLAQSGVIIIIIIMSVFLECLSRWNMFNCAEQVQIQKYKTHAYKTLKTVGVQKIMLKQPTKHKKEYP